VIVAYCIYCLCKLCSWSLEMNSSLTKSYSAKFKHDLYMDDVVRNVNKVLLGQVISYTDTSYQNPIPNKLFVTAFGYVSLSPH
jgi:hypothetical protein